MITFKANGRMAEGYLASPEGGRGPGIIVIQEWWGLVGHITDVADRFAAAGYFALAPDMYHGEKTKSPDEAGKLMMALNIAEAAKDLRGAAEYLTGLEGVTTKKVGVIGFCMGGQLALFAACEAPDVVGAAIDFYGIHPAVKPDFSKLSGPVQGHFGKRDKSVPATAVGALGGTIAAVGKTFEPYFYEADHAFFNDKRPEVYNPEAAKLAWTRVLDFLKTNLK